MSNDAVIVTFPENSATYEAFSKLTGDARATGVESAALLSRDENGALSAPETYSPGAGSGLTDGGLIGALVGVLGGPIGVLLGWGIGSMWGSADDLDKADEAELALSEIGRAVPAGRNAIVAVTTSDDAAAFDARVGELGGTVLRRPLDEVIDEVEAAEDAQEAAAEAAAQRLRERKHEEKKAERHQKVEDFKKKLHL